MQKMFLFYVEEDLLSSLKQPQFLKKSCHHLPLLGLEIGPAIFKMVE
jgi:hypothetical protein